MSSAIAFVEVSCDVFRQAKPTLRGIWSESWKRREKEMEIEMEMKENGNEPIRVYLKKNKNK